MALVKIWYIFIIHSVTFTKHPDPFISCMSYERLQREEHFHIKKWLWEKPRFHGECPWKLRHKNVTFYRQKLYEKVRHKIVATNALASFCIVTHRYTASFSQKIVLCETNNIFYSLENLVWHKVNDIFWKCKWNKGKVTIEGNTPLSPPWKNSPLPLHRAISL